MSIPEKKEISLQKDNFVAAISRSGYLGMILPFCIIAVSILTGIYLTLGPGMKAREAVVRTVTRMKSRESADQAVSRMAILQKEIFLLDSILTAGPVDSSISATGITPYLYALSDTVKLKTSRVEIGDKIILPDRIEMPILVHGTGTWETFGEFCAGIENMPAPVKIRQMVLKKIHGEQGEAVLDFVVMEERK